MQRLTCDIKLGGCTSQFLEWHKRNTSKPEFINALISAITYKAKTLPHKQARRAACLIGLVYDQLDADEYLLDCIISAVGSLK